MQELNQIQITQVSGAGDRENNQFIAAMVAGAFSGGNGFVMGAAGWLMGQYHDFQSGVKVNGPSGPSSNHFMVRQYRISRIK